MIRDPNLEQGRRSSRSSEVVPVHDWRLRRPEPEALRVFDSSIRERLTPILARREAELAAERSLSPNERAKLWRVQLKQRRQEFADALELSLSPPFSLDAISRPERDRHALCDAGDIEAAFDLSSASWLRDGLGGPAMVVTQPHYLDYAAAVDVGFVECAKFTRNIDIIEAPNQLGWVGPERKLLMWVPDRRIPLDG
jgi:hypothetical protein